MKARPHETIDQLAAQQVPGRVQAQMSRGKQLGGTGEESHSLVCHQKRLTASKRNAGRGAGLCSQIVQLATPWKRSLAPVGKILLIGIEAEETVAMAVVRQGKTAAHAGAGARLAGNAHGADGHTRSSIADASPPLAQLAKQSLAFKSFAIVRGERYASRLQGGHVLGLDVLVQSEGRTAPLVARSLFGFLPDRHLSPWIASIRKLDVVVLTSQCHIITISCDNKDLTCPSLPRHVSCAR